MIQEHGGSFPHEGELLDFSVNLNPLGMPESVKKAVISTCAGWERYPNPLCTELTEKLAERENVPPERIVCGNGAADLIYRAVHAFKPARAVIFAPTFGEYAKALTEVGCVVREHYLSEKNGFLPDESFLETLTADVDMAAICSPNNPTGQLMPPNLLEKTARKCRENGILLVCDECFMGFAGKGAEHSLARFMNERCIILKAFTKLYCMAGLRLGYAVCGSEETAERLRRSGQYWSVSAPAQAAGIAALDEREYVSRTVEIISREREFLTAELRKLGLKVYPSAANYLLFRGEKGLGERLLARGIGIRCCESYSGLDGGFYRAAVRTREENMRLIKALEGCGNVKG